jgi:cell division septum initiation protein DivIVA
LSAAAIAGLRLDMAAMQTHIHGDMFNLKAAIDLQGDSLRKEIGVQAASLRADMTAFREAVSQRFERFGTQLRGLQADTDQRFDAVDQRFEAVDQRFDSLDAKLDTILSELRRPAE